MHFSRRTVEQDRKKRNEAERNRTTNKDELRESLCHMKFKTFRTGIHLKHHLKSFCLSERIVLRKTFQRSSNTRNLSNALPQPLYSNL